MSREPMSIRGGRRIVLSLVCAIIAVSSLTGCRTPPPKKEAASDVTPEERRRISRAERTLKSDDAQKRRQAAIELLAMSHSMARSIVIRALGSDSSADVRVNMIEAIGFVEDHESFRLILSLIDDPNSKVREAAAQTLGRFKRPEEFQQVIAKLDDPATTMDGRILLTNSVGISRSRDAVPVLINNLVAPSMELRKVTYDALTKITGRDFPPEYERWKEWWENNRWKSREELLEDRLQDTEQIIANQKREIAQLSVEIRELVKLGSSSESDRVALLLKSLQSPYDDIRAVAAHTLASLDAKDLQKLSLDDNDTVNALKEALKDDDVKVRLNVVTLISKLNGKFKDQLISVALGDSDAEVLRRALGLVRKDSDGGIVKQVLFLLSHKDQNVREDAITILADHPPKEAVQSLVSVLNDPSETVRWLAVESLRKRNAKSAVKDILPLASDKSDRVREVTVLTLGELGDAGAVDVLIKALRDKNERVRQQAAKALQLVGANTPAVARKVADELVKHRFYGPALEVLKGLEDSYAKDPKKADGLRKIKLERVKLLRLNKDNAGAVRVLALLEKETPGDPDIRRELLQSWMELNDLPALFAAVETWLAEKDKKKQLEVMGFTFDAARQLAEKDKKKEALQLLNVLKKAATESKAEDMLKNITTLQKNLENKGG